MKGRGGKLPKNSNTSVDKKPSASFSYLQRTIAVITKSLTQISIRSNSSENNKIKETHHGDEVIPQSLIDWEKKK
ncbi:hypothetical protein HA466_0293390 [Hirschfeldia incana]|nr:hypothetical protein HA466_0293390 [Hirschfeldia incana]